MMQAAEESDESADDAGHDEPPAGVRIIRGPQPVGQCHRADPDPAEPGGTVAGTAAGLAGDFAGHSLRAGFATEGYAQGTPELAIMRHGRWRSASVMRGCVEEGSIWNDNGAARLGL